MELILPIIAGFLYALAALLVKRGQSLGLGVMRSLFLSNLFMGGVICGFCIFSGLEGNWALWYLPVIAGVCFVLGQVTTFMSITFGDVSVTTPVLGLKTVFVAFFAALIWGEVLPLLVWVAAFLSFVGVALLSSKGKGPVKSFAGCLVSAVVSALFFALADSLVGAWASDFGKYGFLFIMFFTVGLSSFLFMPFFKAPLRAADPLAFKWAFGGNLLLAVQALLMALAISQYQEPAQTNILYSSRGVWSVLLVVSLGPLLGSIEHEQGRRVFVLRAVGALVMMAAIACVVV